ncbi:hypothetical protein ABVT39_015720 [Epinephelus coioides]
MERGMFGMLVLSGLCHCVSSYHHQYHFINKPKTWSEARQYCGEKYTDLVTVNDEQDLEELARLIEPGIQFVYLGLHRSWGWSRSDVDDYKEGELMYLNWAKGEPIHNYHFCAGIGENGTWFSTNCSSPNRFFCYKGFGADISERFSLGKPSLSWGDAQAYCREEHTDLARVRNQLENKELQRTVNKGLVWIGLTDVFWVWSDGSEPSFLPWKQYEPYLNGLYDCAVLEVNSKPLAMVDKSCAEKLPFFCRSDPLRKHLVKLKLTAHDSSVDMKDAAVMKSVLKWVEGKLSEKGATKDVKLSWRKLPKKEHNTKQEQTETLEGKCIP